MRFLALLKTIMDKVDNIEWGRVANCAICTVLSIVFFAVLYCCGQPVATSAFMSFFIIMVVSILREVANAYLSVFDHRNILLAMAGSAAGIALCLLLVLI